MLLYFFVVFIAFFQKRGTTGFGNTGAGIPSFVGGIRLLQVEWREESSIPFWAKQDGGRNSRITRRPCIINRDGVIPDFAHDVFFLSELRFRKSLKGDVAISFFFFVDPKRVS